MATRNVHVHYDHSRGVAICTWEGLLNGDDGQIFDSLGYALVSVQWIGTPGAGFSGETDVTNNTASNNFNTVTDLNASGEEILFPTDSRLYFARGRPRVSGGDGTTNMTCIMLFVKR